MRCRFGRGLFHGTHIGFGLMACQCLAPGFICSRSRGADGPRNIADLVYPIMMRDRPRAVYGVSCRKCRDFRKGLHDIAMRETQYEEADTNARNQDDADDKLRPPTDRAQQIALSIGQLTQTLHIALRTDEQWIDMGVECAGQKEIDPIPVLLLQKLDQLLDRAIGRAALIDDLLPLYTARGFRRGAFQLPPVIGDDFLNRTDGAGAALRCHIAAAYLVGDDQHLLIAAHGILQAAHRRHAIVDQPCKADLVDR